jgi:NADH:ubiquinone oxidoreductase subunit F (NADH-binding)
VVREPYLLPPSPITSVDEYLAAGGGLGIARAVDLGPEATIAEVRASGLRGRGGGGFPTATKWAGVRGAGDATTYVVANGAEGEPSTFKDRALLRANPYQVVEGLVIAAFAIGARGAYVAVKASFEQERDALERAATELQQAGVCSQCEIGIVAGPDEYLFGEEKALLEVVEGRAPLPRVSPPYIDGLFSTTERSNPTLVNNVETLAHATHVLANGADWFRARGTEASPGHGIATVVGDVVAPGVAEFELGTSLGDVIDGVGGGVRPGRQVKAVLSGVANPVLTGADLGAQVSYEGMAAAGSGMGAAGFAVYDDTACMVEVARQVSRFLWIESCGQCPPCKLGSGAITEHLDALQSDRATGTTLEDIAGWLDRVTDGNRCYLAVQERVVVTSILQRFADEVAEHLSGPCPRPRPLPFPKLEDLGAEVRYDEAHARKQPDWTYR